MALAFFFFVTLCSFFLCNCSSIDAKVIASWTQLNFSFPDSGSYRAWVANDGPTHCMPAGVKVHEKTGDIFVSVPRWQEHVPATLNRLERGKSDSPLLIPYPSWEANTVGDPKALQSVLGFEIYNNVLFVLDQGTVAGKPAIPGSIKLMGIDLTTDKVMFTLPFDAQTAPLDTSFLNDLVLDIWHDFIYISDSGSPFTLPPSALVSTGGLIAVDMKTAAYRRVLSNTASVVSDIEFWLTINGERVSHASPMKTGSDGIALLPGGGSLLWTPLSSHQLYSLDTALLRNFSVPEAALEAAVVHVGSKGAASDGMVFDQFGNLFAGSLEASGLLNISCTPARVAQANLVAADPARMMWPDTLGFNGTTLVWMSNQLQRFVQGEVDFSAATPNFRIWSMPVNASSYLS